MLVDEEDREIFDDVLAGKPVEAKPQSESGHSISCTPSPLLPHPLPPQACCQWPHPLRPQSRLLTLLLQRPADHLPGSPSAPLPGSPSAPLPPPPVLPPLPPGSFPTLTSPSRAKWGCLRSQPLCLVVPPSHWISRHLALLKTSLKCLRPIHLDQQVSHEYLTKCRTFVTMSFCFHRRVCGSRWW